MESLFTGISLRGRASVAFPTPHSGPSPTGSPARIYFWTQTAMEHIGADVQLHCRASGSPKPVVTWYDSNDQQVVADQKHRVLGTGDLLIRNITFDHMGKYRCVARNVHGTDSVDKVFFYPAKPNVSGARSEWGLIGYLFPGGQVTLEPRHLYQAIFLSKSPTQHPLLTGTTRHIPPWKALFPNTSFTCFKLLPSLHIYFLDSPF